MGSLRLPFEHIIVVGAGLAGLCATLALAPHCKTLTLLNDREIDASPTDGRALALSKLSRSLFERWGIWGAIKQDATDILSVRVSAQGRFGACQLHAAEEGIDAFGAVVPAGILYRHVLAAVQKIEALNLVAPASIIAFDPEQGKMEHQNADGVTHTLHADLVLAADGTRSRMRDLMGIEAVVTSQAQSALVFEVQPVCQHAGIAHERFLDESVLAISDGRFSSKKHSS